MANLKRYWRGWALDPFSDKPLKRQQQIFSSVLYIPLLLFLLIGQGASEKATSPIVMSGMLGGSVTFPLNISEDTEIENVTWKCPSKFLAIAFPKKDALILDRDYNGRLNISSTYSMYISNLTKNDSGAYEAQINQKNSNLTGVEKFVLHIYEKLKKPNVTQSTVHMKDGVCQVQLTCSVEDGGNNVTYTWMPLPKEAVMPHGESSLTVSWKHGESPPSLTCTAHNPVSNSSSQFSSGAVCSGPECTLKIWILLGLIFFCLLGGWYILKQKKQTKGISLLTVLLGNLLLLGFSALCWAIRHMQAGVSAEISELENPAGRMRFSELFRRHEELDMPAMSTRPDPSLDISSDSDATIEEDEEKTTMHSTVNRRNEVYDMVTEDTAHDLASESQAGYQVLTPDDTVVKSEVEEDIAHIQECLNVQGKTPVTQKKENSKHNLLLSTET